jgi:hypothetical protein
MTEWNPADQPGAAEPADWLDGTDPTGWADVGGEPDPFPPALELGVRPADGRSWIDPDLLGDPTAELAGDPPADPPDALRADLAALDGDPDAGWDALHESADPAVRALAARWHR